MDSLIVYSEDNFKFDPNKLLQDIESVPGTYDIRRQHSCGSVLQCDYDLDGDTTTLRLSDGLESFTLDGVGAASRQLALELQKREARPLKVVNSHYSFDFALSDVTSLEDFGQKMDAGLEVEGKSEEVEAA